MYGTAVNPDTRGIAEDKELSTCSDGTLWQASNADEIRRMFQGLGPTSYMPKGSNTLFSIDKKDIPKHKKKPMSVSSVLIAPRSLTPNGYAGLLVVTKLNTLAISPHKLPTSKPPSASLTALSAPPKDAS
jgi:hypothetical protein